MSKDSVINPLTNKPIKLGGTVYKKLLASGHIKEYKNPKIPDTRSKSDRNLGKKLCCDETKCQLSDHLCCIHGDNRSLISIGKLTYAHRMIYVDGIGNEAVIDHAWKNYCPECVSKSHRDTGIKDIRCVISEHGSGSNISGIEIKH